MCIITTPLKVQSTLGQDAEYDKVTVKSSKCKVDRVRCTLDLSTLTVSQRDSRFLANPQGHPSNLTVKMVSLTQNVEPNHPKLD